MSSLFLTSADFNTTTNGEQHEPRRQWWITIGAGQALTKPALYPSFAERSHSFERITSIRFGPVLIAAFWNA